MKAFLYGILLLTVLAIGILWPKDDSLWVVMVVDQNNTNKALTLLNGTSAELVAHINKNTIVIKPSSTLTPKDLYLKGAFLVLNAEAAYGCSSPITIKWGKS